MLRGLYLNFGSSIDVDVNRAVQALTARLLERPLAGVTDVVPSYTNVYLEYDETRVRRERVRRWAEASSSDAAAARPRRYVEIPVDYHGPDLAEIATRTGMREQDVIARHAGRAYHVFALGFTPGFPYMGLVEPALRLPRRATPRARVSAHAVAMANEQTGVYPSASPGGWHLLGTALVPVYDPHRPEPFLLRPGDEVRFVSVPPGPAPPEREPLSLLPRAPQRPCLEVVEPGFCDLVVDRGRLLMGRFGLARGGPVDAWSAAQANALIGNTARAATVEFTLRGPTLVARSAGVAGFAGWGMQPLRNGEPLDCFSAVVFAPGDVIGFRPLPFGARGYLALPGGVESDRFAHSATVDLRAGIGRPLAPDDVLGANAPCDTARAVPRASAAIVALGPEPFPLRIVRGPQATTEALAVLCERPFVVRAADRMGVRLAGAAVPGGEVLSEATGLGAIQITPDGDPIVLLHDRGTLGGYAKPAVIDPRDLARVGQLLPGQRVGFHLARREEPA